MKNQAENLEEQPPQIHYQSHDGRQVQANRSENYMKPGQNMVRMVIRKMRLMHCVRCSEQLSEAVLAERDSLADIFGWDASGDSYSQSSSKGYSTTMSQKQVRRSADG